MDIVGNAEMWALVVGFISPPVVALINRRGWSSTTKALVAFAFALVVGTITAWLTGSLTGLDWVGVILTVLVTSIATYHGLWKPTGATEAITTATNGGRHSREYIAARQAANSPKDDSGPFLPGGDMPSAGLEDDDTGR